MSWHHFFFSKGTGIGKAETVAEEIQVAAPPVIDHGVPPQAESESFSEKDMLVTPPMPQPVILSQMETVTVLSQETEKIILPEGKTLRLLALDIFGNREFWVYIYLANKDKIPNPNRVPSGTMLVLPDKSVYSINAADPHSVAKAKSLGNELLRGF